MTESEIAQANLIHDMQHGDPIEYQLQRVPCSFKEQKLILRGPLTDRKIKSYAKQGYFTQEFNDQRKEYWAKKRGQRRREGNFDIVEGRLVYRP